MSDDSWGYTAEEEMKAVLGDKKLVEKINKKEDAMSPEKMREYINLAPSKKNVSYSDESRRFAKELLKTADSNLNSFIKEPQVIAEKCLEGKDFDLTGFMFGWAVNAVRYVLHKGPIKNPAIIEIKV